MQPFLNIQSIPIPTLFIPLRIYPKPPIYLYSPPSPTHAIYIFSCFQLLIKHVNFYHSLFSNKICLLISTYPNYKFSHQHWSPHLHESILSPLPECSKLRASCTLCPTCPPALLNLVPSIRLCFTRPTCLSCLSCLTYPRALRALHVLRVWRALHALTPCKPSCLT